MTPTQAQVHEAVHEFCRKFGYDGLIRTLTAAAEVGDKDDIERAFEAGSKHGWESVKAATIERCAQVADKWGDNGKTAGGDIARAIAAAIRELKDKS